MSDVKLNGVVPQVKLAVVALSTQKTQDDESAIQKGGASKQEITSNKLDSLNEVQKNSESQETKQKEIESAVTKLNDYVQSVQRDLQFNLDEESGKTIITVVDRKTSAVIRQIPDDVALKLAQDLQQNEPLSLFNAKV